MRKRAEKTRVVRACAWCGLAGSVLALAGTPGWGQQAYFSFEGDFPTTGGDQHDFFFTLANDQAATPGMFLRTYAGSGGTNLAGDTIPNGPIDPILELFTAGGVSVTSDDDSFVLDSQIDFTSATDGGALPDPLTAGDYRLNHLTFGNDDAGPWALDLAGPAGNLTLTGASPVGGSTVTSLKLGTIDTGMGTDAATFNNAGNLTLTGPLVVAQTGNAVLTHSAGTLVVNGSTTVNAGGTLNAPNTDSLFTDGPINVNGGTLNRGNAVATYNVATQVDNGGSIVGDLTFIGRSAGFTGDVTVTGTGSSMTANGGGLRVGEFGNGILTVEVGGTLTTANATVATFAGSTGSLTVADANTTWTNNGPLFVGGSFSDPGGTGTVLIANGATATHHGTTTVYAPGTIILNSGGVFNAQGDVNVLGGTINSAGASGNGNLLNLAAGRTLTASADAQLVFAGDYDLTGGATVQLTDGADLSVGSDLDIGNAGAGTVIVDGPGTTLNVGPGFSSVGLTSNGNGTLTVRNGASASFNGELNVATGANGVGNVGVESGADLTLNSQLLLAHENANATAGTLTVNGIGSTVTQNGGSGIDIGRSAGPTGTLHIADGGVFTTGTGTATVHATGTVKIDTQVNANGVINSAQLVLNGDLVVEAGALVTADAGQIVAGTTPGATFINRGTFRPRSVSAEDEGAGQSTISGPAVSVPFVQEAGGTFEIGPAAGEGFFIPSLTKLFLDADYTLAGELRLIADRTGDPLTDLGFMTPYAFFPEELITNSGPDPTRTGVFDTVTGHILGDGTALAIRYDGAHVNARRVLYGDGNLSGQIEQADLDAVLQNWGKSNLNGNNDDVSWVTGDFNGNGQVEQGDLDAVLQNWGSTTAPDFTGYEVVAVPEPGGLAAVLAGYLLAIRRRR